MFVIAVLAVAALSILVSTASARKSLDVPEPAQIDATDRLPSSAVHEPLQVEVLGRYPLTQEGIFPEAVVGKYPLTQEGIFPEAVVGKYPLTQEGIFPEAIVGKYPLTQEGIFPEAIDAARMSQLWNAFPEAPHVELFAKAPIIDMGLYPEAAAAKYPQTAEGFNPSDGTRRLPSLAVPHPLEMDPERKTPSHEVALPLEMDPERKTPSHEVALPLEMDPVRRTPSLAVPHPLEVECYGPTMTFNMKQDANVEIVLYAVNGRVIRTLADSDYGSGVHTLTWDGRDDNGARVASGVYFARVQAGTEMGRGKLVLVR